MEGTSPTARFPLPEAPPTVLSIIGISGPEVEGHSAFCQAIFDTTVGNPLLDPAVPPESADPAKWSLVFGGMLYECASLTLIDFQRIEGTFNLDGAAIGPDRLSYSNAPSDIADTLGRQLQATNWPL